MAKFVCEYKNQFGDKILYEHDYLGFDLSDRWYTCIPNCDVDGKQKTFKSIVSAKKYIHGFRPNKRFKWEVIEN
jgi:hypothetical protein